MILRQVFRGFNTLKIQNGLILTSRSINRFLSKDQQAETAAVESPLELKTEIEHLKSELNKSIEETGIQKTKYKELEDKYLRALADSENIRMRLTKQIQDTKIFAIQSFCKDLTEIEDILRLAIESVPKGKISDDNKYLKDLYQGLNMTEARLLQVFKHHGLTQINPLNEKFNPNEHEAVLQKEEEGKESGSVIFVSKLGYKLNDRVIRPAIVGVAK